MDERKARIRELYEKAARRRKLAAELADLEEQRQELANNAETLRNAMELEEEDVKRLEKASISNFFIELSGRMGEKMNQERRKAYAAATRYHAAAAELENIEKTVAAKRKEYDDYGDCEKELEEAVADAVEAVKTSGQNDEAAERIIGLEQKMLEQDNKIRELNEAIIAGKTASEYIDPVMKNLDSAENWGAFDIFGGGLLASIAKHEKLDQAQYEMENLQKHLNTFRTELADVNINADIQISMDEFSRFADWFFDGFFVDSFFLDKIQKIQTQVYDLQHQIYNLIDHMEAALRQAEAEKSRLKAALEQIVAG